jgi:dihydroorotate dehydrogenase
MERVYTHADYITVNLSSPNTPGLRSLQFGDTFIALLTALKQKQLELSSKWGQYKPVLIKIAPDMETDDLTWIANALLDHKIDGVIATNTTVDRQAIGNHPMKEQSGGLSGAPLTHKAQQVTEHLAQIIKGRMPIIGVGGIISGADGAKRVQAGAQLIQLYTGLIFHGPDLVAEVADAIASAQALRQPE